MRPLFLVGLASPALEPSMLGKRPMCFVETLIYSVPPLLALWFIQRRLYPLRPVASAMLAGLSSGLIPAVYMQFACMYEPLHILAFHIGPGLGVALIAALLPRLLPAKHAVKA